MAEMSRAEIAARDAARGYTDEDFEDVSDNPPLTPEELAEMRPLEEAMPELHDALVRHRGRQKAPVKEKVSIRLSPEVLAHYRASGPGWQARIDQDLRARLPRRLRG